MPRLRSAWASAQSDQSSLCTLWVAKDPNLLQVDSEDSDQSDLSLHLAHRSICRFCRATAQLVSTMNKNYSSLSILGVNDLLYRYSSANRSFRRQQPQVHAEEEILGKGNDQ